MLRLSFFFPIPAFHFEHLVRVILSDESGLADLKLFPTRIEILHHNFSSFGLDHCFISPYFHEFDVRIAFVPEVEEAVGVHQLFGFPFHSQEIS